MADITSQISTLSVKLTMYRDSDESTKTRTFSVRDPAINEENPEPFRQSLQDLQNFLLGDGKTLIQPTGWRDDDTTEGEYTTTAVEFTTETGVGTKWDTRLSRNMSITPSTIASSAISTDVNVGSTFTLTAAGASASDILVSRNMTGTAILPIDWFNNTGDGIIVFMLGDSTSTEASGDIVFSTPAEGVYQADSVTLEVIQS